MRHVPGLSRFTFRIVLLTLFAATAVFAQVGHPTERQQLLTTRVCDRCDLSGEGFDRFDLKGVSLADATLAGVKFYKADLTNANLGGADLTGAVMSFAILNNTNLGGAKLAGANLAGAVGADLSAATTTETTVCPNTQNGPCR